MQIILDETRKEGILVKKDGTEISRYSYKNLITKDFTFDQLKKDIDNFNTTLETQDEFDNIKELSRVVNLHTW